MEMCPDRQLGAGGGSEDGDQSSGAGTPRIVAVRTSQLGRLAALLRPTGCACRTDPVQLQILRLFETLVACESPTIDVAIEESGALPAAVELFFACPTKPLVHNAVMQLLLCLLSSAETPWSHAATGENSLRRHLISDTVFIDRIVVWDQRGARGDFRGHLLVVASALQSLHRTVSCIRT